jgi:integrase
MSKKLDPATIEQKVTGTSPETQQELKGKILEYAWRMKKNGLSPYTIKNRTYRLSRLVELGADLTNVESVETLLATEEWKTSIKKDLVSAYTAFTKAFNIHWNPIKVRYEAKMQYIPTLEECTMLISGCGKRTSAYLQAMLETGARRGEVSKLNWTDIDEKNKKISINHPLKGGNARTIKVSERLIAMLKTLPHKHGDYIFNPRPEALGSTFYRTRNKLAAKLQNPNLKKIHFHTFRHLKGTTSYYEYKNLYMVKEILGHKCVSNTDRYIHYASQAFSEKDGKFVHAHAKTLEEEDALIDQGFQFVRYSEEHKVAIYRKPK